MMRITVLLLCFLGAVACNNNAAESSSLLNEAPYAQLTDSIRQQPGNADMYYSRGVLLYQNMQLQYAEEDIRKAWQLLPSEAYALSLTTILRQKSADEAIGFLQKAIEKLPASIALQIALARGYQSKGNHAKALEITSAIIKQHPGQLDALTLKSELLAQENKTHESLTYLEKAYALAPSDPELAYDLAYEYAQAKSAKALAITDSAIQAKAPEIEKAFYIRGVYFSNLGNPQQALTNFNQSIAANYNFLDAYREKGQLLLHAKNFAAALKTFDLALKVAPAAAAFYYLSGQALQGMGKKMEAKLRYQKAFGLDKSMTEAKEAAEKL